MAVVSTLIINALVLTGEKSIQASTLTTGETNYHLSRLNSMMDSWSNERLMIHQLNQTSFALTASQGSYTIGSGGNFNMTRPTKIVDPCFIRDTDDTDTELQLINAQAYGRLPDKTLDGTYPQYLFYDYGYSATSTGTVYLYPEPQAGLTLFINTYQPLQSFSTVSVTLLLPPGYQDAIELNYAVRSALGVAPVPPELERAAMKAKAAIKSQNLPAPISRLDYFGLGWRGDILSGP
jgi:hypothetical protein